MKKFQFNIGKKRIGDGQKCFVVAEMSANHAGSLNNAIKIVRLAKKCGADAIKLQTYTPNTITLKSKRKDFLISKKSPWFKYKNLWNLYNYA
jgi:sialic acid synthase SpsE